MRDPIDKVLAWNPFYPPGFGYADLENEKYHRRCRSDRTDRIDCPTGLAASAGSIPSVQCYLRYSQFNLICLLLV
jgi:hypothetical protein